MLFIRLLFVIHWPPGAYRDQIHCLSKSKDCLIMEFHTIIFSNTLAVWNLHGIIMSLLYKFLEAGFIGKCQKQI
jgi:hypothetical protein